MNKNKITIVVYKTNEEAFSKLIKSLHSVVIPNNYSVEVITRGGVINMSVIIV